MQANSPTNQHTISDVAARLGLTLADETRRAAGIDPKPYLVQLIPLVIIEVRKAVEELANDQLNGGPVAALLLTQNTYRNIYFADAGRRSAANSIDESTDPQATSDSSSIQLPIKGGP